MSEITEEEKKMIIDVIGTKMGVEFALMMKESKVAQQEARDWRIRMETKIDVILGALQIAKPGVGGS